MLRIGRVGGDVASGPTAEHAVLVRLPADRDRIVGETVNGGRHLDRSTLGRAGCGVDLDDLVVVAARVQVGRVQERHEDTPVRRYDGRGHEGLIEAPGDGVEARPGGAASWSDETLTVR